MSIGEKQPTEFVSGRSSEQRLCLFKRVTDCASDTRQIVAAGDWSKPVADTRGYAVRGRLVLREKPRSDDRREVAVYVELQDKDKKPVKATSFPFGGAVPKSEWVTLPSDATIRLRASPFGIHRPKAMAISSQLNQLSVIGDDDSNEYFLSGTFTVDPEAGKNTIEEPHIWRGTIVLPAARIVNPRK